MKLEDLFKKCERCSGDGNVVEADKIRGGSYSGPCPDCRGEGGKLTEDGRELKEFILMIHNKPGLK